MIGFGIDGRACDAADLRVGSAPARRHHPRVRGRRRDRQRLARRRVLARHVGDPPPGLVHDPPRGRAPARGPDRVRRLRHRQRLVGVHRRRDRVRVPRCGPGARRDDQPPEGSMTKLPDDDDALLRPLVPALAVLRRHAARGVQGLRHLQQDVPAGRVRRSRGRVPGAPGGRDPLGRRGRAHRADQRPRRRPAGRLDHVPRSHPLRRQAVQVHARDGALRRDRERPGAGASRGERVVDAARRLRRRPLRARRPLAARSRRRGLLPRRPSVPGAGAALGPDAGEARRREHLRPALLLVRPLRDRRHPGRHHPDRLVGGARVRGEPARRVARRRRVGRDHGAPARSSRSGRSLRTRPAASRPASSTAAPTSRSPTRRFTSPASSGWSRSSRRTTSARRRSRRCAARASTGSWSASSSTRASR